MLGLTSKISPGNKKKLASLVARHDLLYKSASFLEKLYPGPLKTIHAIRDACHGTACTGCMPSQGVLNLTDICNYRCSFCEIHHVHETVPVKYKNIIDLEVIQKYEPWISRLSVLNFYGSVGEPMINPHFVRIATYLKERYPRLSLGVNTNGFFLDPATADALIRCGFNNILVSMHAADQETYQKLLGGNFDRVVSNIRYYTSRKGRTNRLGINFMLNRLNAHNTRSIIDFAGEYQLDYISVNSYYDVRNKLDRDVSYYFDPAEGNRLLDELYRYARQKKVTLTPVQPCYYHALEDTNAIDLEHLTPEGDRCCRQPWSLVQFKGSLDYPDSHYVSVCNRLEPLLINYKEFFSDPANSFDDIWNHNVIKFLRETVNSPRPNLICQLCRSREYRIVRCLDNEKYRQLRDHAVQDFFVQFKKRYGPSQDSVRGLRLYEETPYR